MKVFAENYRGFKWVELDLNKVTFLVGDNSSGKSSLIYLVDAISRTDLQNIPRMNEDLGLAEFDYFSPYFDYDDVTFGYETNKDDIKFVKMITVKRRMYQLPEVTRCSYYAHGKMISFKTRGDLVYSKTMKCTSSKPSDLLLCHKSTKGYKVVKDFEKIPLFDPSLLLAAYESNRNPFSRDVFRYAINYILDEARVISPTRALPEKFYNFRRKFNIHGLHFASMLMDLSQLEKSPGFSSIERFGEESALFDSLKVQRISTELESSPLIVTVEKHGRELLLNQVGVGVSQVMPVLIDTLYASTTKDTTILMQQPELHLHPIAQAALGTYLYGVSAQGLRPIIETHSSYLIDRFRAELRDNNKVQSGSLTSQDPDNSLEVLPSDVQILFCRNSNSGNYVTAITIDGSGKLKGDPDEYHDFFVDETIRTMF